MSDHLSSLGTLGFTYRTRRLTDRLAEAGRRFYDAVGLPLEPNWHALLLYLDEHGAVSVTEAATAMRVSHPAVIEMARRMQARGLLEAEPDPADGRRRVLTLSADGRRQLPRFRAVWAEMAAELEDILEEACCPDALACLDTIEAALDRAELDTRVLQRRQRAGGPERRPARHGSEVEIRATSESDRAEVLRIARELVRTADTYAYDPAVSDEELWRYWHPAGPGRGFVAVRDGQVVGMFVIRPNIPGPGSHVANASYAVRADLRGSGLGRRMGEVSLALAQELGYRAMQFNTVVSSNAAAVRLWRSLGFRIVGTVPDGFRLPDGRTVPHHVMYRALA